MIFRSPQISHLWSSYFTHVSKILIFSYVSFKLTECAIGSEATVLLLYRRTAFKLRFEESINNLHSLALYSIPIAEAKPFASQQYTRSVSALKNLQNSSSRYLYCVIIVLVSRKFLSRSLEASNFAEA